ncbi:hypothetical protein DFH11DRAFT_1550621 [Phellopilus nigrolimitatus]|nr:hypothetical protein DFH11DRAFT_1550621 [Phellopilus nigrolimitatus]
MNLRLGRLAELRPHGAQTYALQSRASVYAFWEVMWHEEHALAEARLYIDRQGIITHPSPSHKKRAKAKVKTKGIFLKRSAHSLWPKRTDAPHIATSFPPPAPTAGASAGPASRRGTHRCRPARRSSPSPRPERRSPVSCGGMYGSMPAASPAGNARRSVPGESKLRVRARARVVVREREALHERDDLRPPRLAPATLPRTARSGRRVGGIQRGEHVARLVRDGHAARAREERAHAAHVRVEEARTGLLGSAASCSAKNITAEKQWNGPQGGGGGGRRLHDELDKPVVGARSGVERLRGARVVLVALALGLRQWRRASHATEEALKPLYGRQRRRRGRERGRFSVKRTWYNDVRMGTPRRLSAGMGLASVRARLYSPTGRPT